MNLAGNILEGPVCDVGWCMQRADGVDQGFFHGKMTEASFERFMATAMRSIDSRGDDERVAQLHEVRDPVLMDSRWRGRMSRALKAREHKLAITCPAYAMVTESMFTRAALKAMFWMAPPPHPVGVFSTVAEACRFIARHMPDVDPEALEREQASLRAVALAKPGPSAQE